VARKVFYSFHYKPDCWRVGTVRNIGAIEDNPAASDNDWESVTKRGDDAIENWIASQMAGRTCTVVLVGAETANRKWINHEIVKSWNDGLGVVGIRIHGLKNAAQETSSMGGNPFDHVQHNSSGKLLSSIVKCYDPPGYTSQDRYAWIKANLPNAVEEAIRIRSAS
jgi:hypothetical protein